MPRPRRRKVNRDEWGSITRTEDGAWRLRYRGPDGKRRDGGRYVTRAEADDARARIRASILGGTWRPSGSSESPLLADYVASWLQRAELAEDLSPRTVALYRRMFDRLVLPEVGGVELGRVPIGKLTRETVLAWEVAARTTARANAARHSQGMNGAAASRRRGHPARAWARSVALTVPSTGRLPAAVLQAWRDAGSPTEPVASPQGGSGDRQFAQARTALSSVCTTAVEEGYLGEHPVRMRPGTRPRRRRDRPARTVPIVSVEVLLQIVAALPAPYGLAALLTAFAGLRGGETLALTIRHLLYGQGRVVDRVRVDRAMVDLPRAPVSFGPPRLSRTPCNRGEPRADAR